MLCGWFQGCHSEWRQFREMDVRFIDGTVACVFLGMWKTAGEQELMWTVRVYGIAVPV